MKYNTFDFFIYIYLFFGNSPRLQDRVRQLNGFLRAMAQKTRSRARMCLLGVKNVEINNEPLFMPPQTSNFGKKVDLEIFWPKTLYNGDAHLQTTLNCHHSPIKVV